MDDQFFGLLNASPLSIDVGEALRSEEVVAAGEVERELPGLASIRVGLAMETVCDRS